jgi:DNA-binding transcriptional ArsR family regulator
MPVRAAAVQELATLLTVLSHPDRIRIIEELRASESDVSALTVALELKASRVSQHLAMLRTHRLVQPRREGRHVFYRLASPGIAQWLAHGLDFVEASIRGGDDLRSAVQETRHSWLDDEDEDASV